MGYYINQTSKGIELPAKGKTEELIADGAVKTDNTFKENLICVIDNGPFEAAGYCYSEDEFNQFKSISNRPIQWLVHPEAKKLANYKQSIIKN